jgi:hypothetical protein
MRARLTIAGKFTPFACNRREVISNMQSHRFGLHRLRGWMRGEVAAPHPGCFALVMATGIISTA